MSRGLRIRITRLVETRDRRPDEVNVKVWNGRRWWSFSSIPYSPRLAWIYGNKRKIVTTTVEFLPPGVIPYDKLLYERTLLPKMRAMGVLR